MVLIASGKVFAYVVDAASTSGTVATVIKVVAYIGPYFLIPSMFKLAGGAFATISGMANDRSKGIFDRQKKYRGQKAAKNFSEVKAGDKAWRPRSFNNLGERVGVGVGGRFGFGARGRASVQTQRRNNAAERMAKDEDLKQLALASDDGTAVMALSGGTAGGARAAADELRESWIAGGMSRADATVKANQALSEAQAVGFSRSKAQAAMSLMAQNKARSIAGGAAGRAIIENGLGRLHGGSAANAGAMEETRQSAQFFARQAGRSDLGGATTSEAISKSSLYTVANGQPKAVDDWGSEMVASAQTGALTNNPQLLEQAAIARQELEAMRPNATGDIRNAIDRQITALDSSGLQGYINASSGRIDPATGAQRQVPVRENFVAGAAGWNAADQARGWRTVTRDENMGDLAGRKARTYQRPDEANL